MTKRKTHNQESRLKWPEWRLYANFLHRELARLWYGKKSVFNLVKSDQVQKRLWSPFALIWGMIVGKFGEEHGLALDEMVKVSIIDYKQHDKLSSQDITPESPFYPFYWFARQTLGDKLASEFLFDFQITEIIILAMGAYGKWAMEGKPPDVKDVNLHPIDFYEGLPVAPELEEYFYGSSSPKS